ncbi:MAG: NUDIX-like domain-containing protein, partial [Rudaea sp.]
MSPVTKLAMGTPAGFEAGVGMPASLPPATRCFVWRDDKILVRAGDTPSLPTLDDLLGVGIDGTRHYLGRLDAVDRMALRVAADTAEPEGWQWRGLRSLFFQLAEAEVALAGRAFQIVEWDRSHQFCGRCGSRTREKTNERAKECPACGYVVYPRMSPAMMVLVTRGRDVLLARANRFPTAMYSALAGFVEAGESIEDCV